jgi:hypothetical protein
VGTNTDPPHPDEPHRDQEQPGADQPDPDLADPDQPGPDPARHETAVQRLDRNFDEILQELRVMQTGVQILFAFLLTLAFTARFEQVTAGQRALYFGTLGLTTAATGLLIAPVAFHRITFRRRMRPQLVEAANRLALAGLGCLGFALVGSLLFIADVILDIRTAVLFAGAAALWLAVLWFLLPVVELLRGERRQQARRR